MGLGGSVQVKSVTTSTPESLVSFVQLVLGIYARGFKGEKVLRP